MGTTLLLVGFIGMAQLVFGLALCLAAGRAERALARADQARRRL